MVLTAEEVDAREKETETKGRVLQPFVLLRAKKTTTTTIRKPNWRHWKKWRRRGPTDYPQGSSLPAVQRQMVQACRALNINRNRWIIPCRGRIVQGQIQSILLKLSSSLLSQTTCNNQSCSCCHFEIIYYAFFHFFLLFSAVLGCKCFK